MEREDVAFQVEAEMNEEIIQVLNFLKKFESCLREDRGPQKDAKMRMGEELKKFDGWESNIVTHLIAVVGVEAVDVAEVEGHGQEDHGRHADEEDGGGAPQEEHQPGLLCVLLTLLPAHLQGGKGMDL